MVTGTIAVTFSLPPSLSLSLLYFSLFFSIFFFLFLGYSAGIGFGGFSSFFFRWDRAVRLLHSISRQDVRTGWLFFSLSLSLSFSPLRLKLPSELFSE